MSPRQRLLRAFRRFAPHFAPEKQVPRRMRIDDAPPIVPETLGD